MKNYYIRIISILAIMVLLITTFVGCGEKDTVDTSINQKIDNLLGYTNPISIESAMSYYVSSSLPEGQTETDNYWTRLYKQRGINVKYRFSAPNNQYTEKLNADIATGNIPDIFTVNITQLSKLIKADLIYSDLTQVFEKYATEDTKRVTGGLANSAFKKITVDGKLKAIPWTGSDYDSAEIMYIRKDWLENVGLPAPKTIDELEKVLKAFVENDPDKNGENDTVGLVGNKELFKNAASFAGIFNAYGAYPEIWIEESNKLTWGYFSDKMKAPLLKLADWYKKGLMYKEFAVKDSQKAAGLVQSGKAGIFFGNMALPLWPLSTTVANDFKTDWLVLPIPSLNAATPAKTSINLSTYRYQVVSKKCKNPEALVILLNNFIDQLWGAKADYEKVRKIHSFAIVQAWPDKKNLDAAYIITEAIDSKDDSKLNAEQRTGYVDVKAYIDRGSKITDVLQVDSWSYSKIFYKGGSQFVIDDYIKNNNFVRDKWDYFDTPTMLTKKKAIESNMKEAIIKIIMDGSTIDNYQKAIDEVMKMGAKDMLSEANKVYSGGK